MNKITKALSAISQIVRKPWLLNLVVNQEENFREKVTRQYTMGNGLPVMAITDLFGKEFGQAIHPYAFLEGSCTPMDIALLKSLAQKFSVESYLEIGTWRGESVANVASVAKRCVTLNLPDNLMAQMGMHPDYIAMHRFFSQNLPNVTHLQGNSLHFDFHELQGDFDMVFIDGDHHYEMVATDTRNIFNRINPEKTIVVWHDYANNPEEIRWSVLLGILDGTPGDLHNCIVHVFNTLCAVYLPEGMMPDRKVRPFKANHHPDYAFEVEIKARKV